MKLMAVCALACGFVAAPIMTAGAASGSPTCDGAGCVPYVARDVEEGTHCMTQTRYIFGFDSSGRTLVCGAKNGWVQVPPLIGVRTLRAPCDGNRGTAQSPDGVPLSCKAGGWTADYTAVYY